MSSRMRMASLFCGEFTDHLSSCQCSK